MEQRDFSSDAIDTEHVLDYGLNVLVNPSNLWKSSSLNEKQRYQQVLFPEGLEYQGGSNRPTATGLLFSGIEQAKRTGRSFGSPDGNRTRIPALRGQYPNR